ncbi:hypothetical protein E2562_035740 [Oryza meyeriana var. granulata]|uniref:Uncharacterized protein n=1 Tax=Oryza meyeriana var. granulata TaxID=110450 RepID=A0A6G1E7Q1_9ORYZ|nr:hypothetical protein E2562_035740 [Oryza meyeriana var. granulata]
MGVGKKRWRGESTASDGRGTSAVGSCSEGRRRLEWSRVEGRRSMASGWRVAGWTDAATVPDHA